MYDHTEDWKITKPKISDVTGKTYTINGHSYCRVTKTLSIIAKNGLFGWYAKVGQKKAGEIMKNRCAFGTKVHTMFEHMLLEDFTTPKKFDSKEEEEDNLLFKLFMYNCSLTPESLEQRLWNDEYEYAGTAEYIGGYTSHKPYCVRGHCRDFKDAFVIGDWKTSSNIYDDYFLQLAAYCYAFWKLTGVKPAGGFIAQFRYGQLKIKERTFDELMELFKVYTSALYVYKWKFKV